jgi:predicted acetyltransferase
MLRAALPLAAHLGVDPALITCDRDNAASRRVIESSGAVRDDSGEDDGVLRYWAPTRSGSHTGRTLPTVGKG